MEGSEGLMDSAPEGVISGLTGGLDLFALTALSRGPPSLGRQDWLERQVCVRERRPKRERERERERKRELDGPVVYLGNQS